MLHRPVIGSVYLSGWRTGGGGGLTETEPSLLNTNLCFPTSQPLKSWLGPWLSVTEKKLWALGPGGDAHFVLGMVHFHCTWSRTPSACGL